MSTGIVKWFNATKGYGFIKPDDGGSDVFVHIRAVEKAGYTGLAEGARISFELKTGSSGKDVRREPAYWLIPVRHAHLLHPLTSQVAQSADDRDESGRSGCVVASRPGTHSVGMRGSRVLASLACRCLTATSLRNSAMSLWLFGVEGLQADHRM